MSVTILEALQNARINLKNGPAALPIARRQLHNAITLLEKGYEPSDEVDLLLLEYASVEEVPEKALPHTVDMTNSLRELHPDPETEVDAILQKLYEAAAFLDGFDEHAFEQESAALLWVTTNIRRFLRPSDMINKNTPAAPWPWPCPKCDARSPWQRFCDAVFVAFNRRNP